MSTPSKTWTKTRYQNLYRHESGVYYARLTVKGKPTWRSLRTPLLSVAREELAKLLSTERQISELNQGSRSVLKMTFADALAARLQVIDKTPSTKQSTKNYWHEIHGAMLSSWPGSPDEDIRKITKETCLEWAGAFSKRSSAPRFNNALGALKNLFELAIEKGLRLANPARSIKRVKPKEKDLGMRLPEPEVFAKWVETIRNGSSRWASDTGDFVEFLTYSGARPPSESSNVTWRHCDFIREELVILGAAEEGTKTRSVRRVSMNSHLLALLKKMRSQRPDEPLDTPILRVNSARDSMNRAGKLVGMVHITQYDLRHLFATRCIESGVDIPVVAKWLGHKDKGALLMRTYNHVRDRHSQQSAKKVTF